MMTSSTLFTIDSNEDVLHLFKPSSTEEENNLFSSINIRELTKQITTSSAPVPLLPLTEEVRQSTLFGTFSEDFEPPSSPVSSVMTLPEEVTEHTIPDEEDVWRDAESLPLPPKTIDTWETFGARQSIPGKFHVNPFVTEQEPKVFDQLLRRHMDHIYSPNESGVVVDEYLFRECLAAVCTGCESSLFRWNEKTSSFEMVIPKVRVIGISPTAAESVCKRMSRRGALFRRLAAVTEKILIKPTDHGSISVTFARAIVSLIQFWQSQVEKGYSPFRHGILSLDLQFKDIDDSLSELAKLCHCSHRTQHVHHAPSLPIGGALLSKLNEMALKFDYPTSSPIRAMGLSLLQNTSTVFLDLLTYWIGLPAPARGFSDIKEWFNMDTNNEFFIRREDVENDIATCKRFSHYERLFEFDEKSVPRFLDVEIAAKVFDVGFGLRLLWRCLPDHPLCDVFDISKTSQSSLAVRWLLSWDDIHQNHAQLKSYEEKIWNLIECYQKNTKSTTVAALPPSTQSDAPIDFGLFDSKQAAAEMLSTTMQNMSLVPSTAIDDPFITTFTNLYHQLRSTTTPPLHIIAQNSFSPAIDIQSRLTQHALLSLFFNTLNLRHHLNILHRYLLFGNGVFVTRLQEALFEDFDGEDARGGGQSGLGLGIGMMKAKDSWPPNGGKVTLVLRNVLSECFSETEQKEVSFAYRELSEERFERVKNAIGLEALDFIQLLYKPPFPLDAVITSSILERYDQLFLFLLRLFRMQYVANQLFRDAASRTSFTQGLDPIAQRFRIEAHHFVTTLAGYIFHVSIESQWHHFQSQLDSVQSSLSSRQINTTISELRELHSKTLDRMMYSCFLKKRQMPILTLLYGTFEPILLFAKTSRMYAQREQRVWSRMREEMADNTRILYHQFVKKAGMFVRVIGELERRGVGKAGEGVGDGLESGWFEDLLVRLDWSYFDR